MRHKLQRSLFNSLDIYTSGSSDYFSSKIILTCRKGMSGLAWKWLKCTTSYIVTLYTFFLGLNFKMTAASTNLCLSTYVCSVTEVLPFLAHIKQITFSCVKRQRHSFIVEGKESCRTRKDWGKKKEKERHSERGGKGGTEVMNNSQQESAPCPRPCLWKRYLWSPYGCFLRG